MVMHPIIVGGGPAEVELYLGCLDELLYVAQSLDGRCWSRGWWKGVALHLRHVENRKHAGNELAASVLRIEVELIGVGSSRLEVDAGRPQFTTTNLGAEGLPLPECRPYGFRVEGPLCR